MKRYLYGIIVWILCCFIIAPAQAGWEWQSPTPQGNSLSDIQMFSDGSGIAVSMYGVVLRTANSGDSWTVYPTPGYFGLEGISFLTPQHGFAHYSGWGGTHIYRTNDGGLTWGARAILTDCEANDMVFLDENTGFVAGGRVGEQGACISRTTNGGSTWQSTYFADQYQFDCMYFLDNQNGWASGSTMQRTTDGGQTWNAINTNNVYPEQRIKFFDPLNGIGIDIFHFYRTTDGGAHWTQTPLADPVTSISAWDLVFLDPQTGYLACGNGRMLSTTNGGTTWIFHQAGNIDEYFTGISAADDQTLVMLGENGRIVKTNNSGSTWTLTAGQRVTDLNFYSTDFYDQNYGWAVGGYYSGGGVIARTTNGGSNWITVLDSRDTTQFGDVAATGPNTAWIVNSQGVLRKTTNGGNSWNVIPLPEGYYAGQLQSLSPDCAWILGNNRLVNTTNGGATWNTVATRVPGSTHKFFFVDMQTGWVFGGKPGTISRTTDGGLSWTQQYCDSILGETVVLDLWFSDTQNGWACVWNSALLHTTNGGVTWVPVNPGILYGDWVTMSWTDANHGWIISDYEQVTFTSDGGATWQQTPWTIGLRQSDVDFVDANHGWITGWNGLIMKYDGTAGAVDPETYRWLPLDISLSAYPNPFNPQTTLTFAVQRAGRVQLSVYDVTGRLVKTLADEMLTAGKYSRRFDGSGLSSGVYFVRLNASGSMTTQKIVLMK